MPEAPSLTQTDLHLLMIQYISSCYVFNLKRGLTILSRWPSDPRDESRTIRNQEQALGGCSSPGCIAICCMSPFSLSPPTTICLDQIKSKEKTGRKPTNIEKETNHSAANQKQKCFFYHHSLQFSDWQSFCWLHSFFLAAYLHWLSMAFKSRKMYIEKAPRHFNLETSEYSGSAIFLSTVALDQALKNNVQSSVKIQK